jgi:phosphoribosyl-AMP cyclohydrolase
LYDPERDGKSKIDHLLEMWCNLVHHKPITFRTVLMDSWYASTKVMKTVEKDKKIYYCPLKSNRQVADQGETSRSYQRVDALTWDENELQTGKLVHVNKFPAEHQLKLFRLVLSAKGAAHGLSRPSPVPKVLGWDTFHDAVRTSRPSSFVTG